MTEQQRYHCLLYTSDAAADLLCVAPGGRRILKKKTKHKLTHMIYLYSVRRPAYQTGVICTRLTVYSP